MNCMNGTSPRQISVHILVSQANKYPCILARILAVRALAFSESKQGATGSCLWAALHRTSKTFRRRWFPYQSAGTLRPSAGLVSTCITDESCHKYHFCRHKHVFVATNRILSRLCRQKTRFVAIKMILVAGPANNTHVPIFRRKRQPFSSVHCHLWSACGGDSSGNGRTADCVEVFGSC